MICNIPKQLQHLRLDERGYPIPFFVPIDKGKPMFKRMSLQKQDLCIDHHLCHICGKKLHVDYCYFISGPIGLKNQVSSDAAMHRECAEFALEICPHMFYQKAERKYVDGDHFQKQLISLEKPDCLFLIKVAKYKVKFHAHVGHRLFHYKSVSAEKYIYVNNKLQKEVIQ